jgi:hypothetical protein
MTGSLVKSFSALDPCIPQTILLTNNENSLSSVRTQQNFNLNANETVCLLDSLDSLLSRKWIQSFPSSSQHLFHHLLTTVTPKTSSYNSFA